MKRCKGWCPSPAVLNKLPISSTTNILWLWKGFQKTGNEKEIKIIEKFCLSQGFSTRSFSVTLQGEDHKMHLSLVVGCAENPRYLLCITPYLVFQIWHTLNLVDTYSLLLFCLFLIWQVNLCEWAFMCLALHSVRAKLCVLIRNWMKELIAERNIRGEKLGKFWWGSIRSLQLLE